MNTTYLSSGQAAERLGISSRTLLRAVKRGDVRPAVKSPGGWLRFRATDIDAYAARRAVEDTHTPRLAASLG